MHTHTEIAVSHGQSVHEKRYVCVYVCACVCVSCVVVVGRCMCICACVCVCLSLSLSLVCVCVLVCVCGRVCDTHLAKLNGDKRDAIFFQTQRAELVQSAY